MIYSVVRKSSGTVDRFRIMPGRAFVVRVKKTKNPSHHDVRGISSNRLKLLNVKVSLQWTSCTIMWEIHNLASSVR